MTQPQVQAALERLFQLHPRMFGARFVPMKLGIYQDLMARHPDAFQKEELKAALGFHARSTRYLECVANGEPRHDLDMNPVEPVAPEHVHHAIMEIFRRRKARGKNDPAPWAREKLVRAIEASGLERDAYFEQVRATDDAALALLDEAFAAIAEKSAKNEALRRAFQASGKTLEEFADMYGLDLKTARAALT
jgi:ProP effector